VFPTGRHPIFAALLVICALSACGPETAPPAQTHPNIVLILVDTLRRDHLSPYGADIETPTVKHLADEGQVFTNVQSSFHQTTMSMGALFTGRTPSIESGDPAEPLAWEGRNWCGMARFAGDEGDSCVPQGLTTLAESLRDAGYWTAGIVSNLLLFAPSGYDQGFDSWTEVGTLRDDLPDLRLAMARSAGKVNAALARVLLARPKAPAFVYIHLLDVHDYRLSRESYAEAVVRLDRQLANTLEILAGAGLRDGTVVFLTSDHGESLGEKHGEYTQRSHFGNPSFQPVLEIPLIVSPPIFESTDRPLRSVDITRLILQAAGLEDDLAEGSEVLEPNELFLSERNFLTYRKGRYKSNFHRTQLGRWALYDLEADPGETQNMIADRKKLAARQLARVREIAEQLSAERPEQEALTEEDAARLRALGYLE
jgi:arylsulfatase A-like enzyme